jgi:predicted metal-binding protein
LKGEAMLRRIVHEISEEILHSDLERYRQKAVELGATEARIIRSNDVIIDHRVLAKCLFPKCPVSGTNINCPPHTPDAEWVKKVVEGFQYAIFFKMEGPYEKDSATSHEMKVKNLEIVSKIEAQAYYDGYYLALGFGGASCKTTLCPDQDCSALQAGKSCRHPLKGRPSMHAVGMDAYKMAARAGWEIYPIGKATHPSEVPFASHLGLILVH